MTLIRYTTKSGKHGLSLSGITVHEATPGLGTKVAFDDVFEMILIELCSSIPSLFCNDEGTVVTPRFTMCVQCTISVCTISPMLIIPKESLAKRRKISCIVK